MIIKQCPLAEKFVATDKFTLNYVTEFPGEYMCKSNALNVAHILVDTFIL